MLRLPAFAFAACSLALAACETTDPGQRAQPVRIVMAQDVRGATPVGQVYGSSSLTGLSRSQGYNEALAEVVEKAAALGATDVVLHHTPRPSYWSTTTTIRGDAYRR
jgi:hypothetical protein